jgi:hypothetical protein
MRIERLVRLTFFALRQQPSQEQRPQLRLRRLRLTKKHNQRRIRYFRLVRRDTHYFCAIETAIRCDSLTSRSRFCSPTPEMSKVGKINTAQNLCVCPHELKQERLS